MRFGPRTGQGPSPASEFTSITLVQGFGVSGAGFLCRYFELVFSLGVGQVVDRLMVKSALERFEAAAQQFASLSLEALSHTDLLAVADRLEAVKRQQARVEHQLVSRSWPPRLGNPDTETPRVDGTPTEDEIRAHLRNPAQRRHDALKAVGRAVLASGTLGQHNGLPVTLLISTTPQELESARGHAVTGGGTVLPMSEVIRLARHAHHYLAVFDKHTNVPLYLGRSRRTASPGQRLDPVLARTRLHPPGLHRRGPILRRGALRSSSRGRGPTDINNLTLACTGDHQMIGPGGWTTRKTDDGHTEWIPPPHLDACGPRTNDFHHPDRFRTQRDGGNPDQDSTDKY